MLKIIRGLLYGAAVLTGVAGLIAGAIPLVKYALQRWRDRAYDNSYFDTTYLYSPEIIFLLSLILLLFVNFSLTQRPEIFSERPARGLQENLPAPKNFVSETPGKIETETSLEKETADEKLARLLKQKIG